MIKMIKMKGAAKKRMQRRPWAPQNYFYIFLFWGHGTTWLTLGTWNFICLAPLGTQFYFILFLFCSFCKIIFSQDRGIQYNYVFFPVFPTRLGTYDFIPKIILVQGFWPPLGTPQGDQRTKNQQIRISIALRKRCPLKKPLIFRAGYKWYAFPLTHPHFGWVFRHSSASSSHCGLPFSATSRQRVHRRYPMISHPTFIHVLLGKICKCSQTS